LARSSIASFSRAFSSRDGEVYERFTAAPEQGLAGDRVWYFWVTSKESIIGLDC